jgi:transcriptional regulator with XRE-family HTH domain
MARITTRLKQLREALGWTQAQLSEKSGVPIQTISRWENDRVDSYDRDVLEKLAKALGVEPGFLLVREEED